MHSARRVRSRVRLFVVGVIALLATVSIALAEGVGTSALFTGSAVATATLQVRAACTDPAIEFPQDLIDDLEPEVRWTFAPGAEPVEWTNSVPEGLTGTASTGQVVTCDDGHLALSDGVAAWSTDGWPTGTVTVLLLIGSPTSDGRLWTLADADGGLGIALDGEYVRVVQWTAPEPPENPEDPDDAGTPGSVETVAEVLVLGAPTARLVALTLSGTEASLWVNGGSDSGIHTALDDPTVFGIGALQDFAHDPDAPGGSATVPVADFAAVLGEVDPADLIAVLGARDHW